MRTRGPSRRRRRCSEPKSGASSTAHRRAVATAPSCRAEVGHERRGNGARPSIPSATVRRAFRASPDPRSRDVDMATGTCSGSPARAAIASSRACSRDCPLRNIPPSASNDCSFIDHSEGSVRRFPPSSWRAAAAGGSHAQGANDAQIIDRRHGNQSTSTRGSCGVPSKNAEVRSSRSWRRLTTGSTSRRAPVEAGVRRRIPISTSR